MAKRVLAISGGVDSMVMLDILVRNFKKDSIIVAHFDHGTRESSKLDAQFVRKKAAEYGVNFATEGVELGGKTSEEKAREARYSFLRKISGKNGVIYTAHHLDDLLETILINLIRGTGWRGLAVLNADGIQRPLLDSEMVYEPMDKQAIFEYAAKRRLEFREDPTNSSDQYLRNRIREQFNESEIEFERKLEIWQLWQKQKKLKTIINQGCVEILPAQGQAWERKWFENLDQNVAIELLRAGTLRAGSRLTRPQLEDFRKAILSYNAGKRFNLPGDRLVRFSRKDFKLEDV